MLSPESALIKLLLNREYYSKYRNYITTKTCKEIQTLYFLLDQVMENHNQPTWDDFCLWVNNNVNDKDLYLALLQEIEKVEVSEEVGQSLLFQYKERDLAHKAAILAIDITEGKKSLGELKALLDGVETLAIEKEELEFVTDNLEELYENHVKKLGLRWRLQTLNRMFGSLRKGDFGFLFARPESGKTTFLASESTFMASQLRDEDGPIIWFNNEEEGRKVQLRVFQAALGLSLPDLFKDRKANHERFNLITRGKIKIVDAPSIDRNRVDRICKETCPSLVIFDQLDKIKGFEGDRDDLRLGETYQWARELAKTYCPVIGVTQADGTGEGKKWLTMDNVSLAKTAKQAEADWILGIGATHAEGFECVRHLHATKNKLTGDEDSDPSMRHGKTDVIIQPEIARYKDYD